MLGAPFRLLYNLLAALFTLLLDIPRLARRPPRFVEVRLEGEVPERLPRQARFLARRRRVVTVARLNDELEAALRDRRIEGVLAVVRGLDGGWARLTSLRDALAAVRARGKRLVAHLSSPTLRDYYVASAADELVVDETGPLELTGLLLAPSFYGEALAKLGARAELAQREEYKSFAETLTRSEMSPAHREAAERMLDVVLEQIAAAVAGGRKVTPEAARALIEGGPYEAQAAKAGGVVDGVDYLDGLRAHLAGATGAGEEAERAATRRVVPIAELLRRRPRLPKWRPLVRRRRAVAVVPVHGMIVPGEGAIGGPFGPVCGAQAVCRALAAARRDPRVAAVVLHVDSRGGAANAADLVWHEVSRAGERKPVIAYFGDVAASGGYYVAAGARRIVAQPLTVTGSIGVLGGKVSFAELYRRLGIGKELLARGPAAAMRSSARPYSEEERRRLEAEIDAIYRQFLDRVARGRGLGVDAVREVARGRVWMGADARERRLVDSLGSLAAAVDLARELGRRRPGERLETIDVPVRPQRSGLLARLFWSALDQDVVLRRAAGLARLAVVAETLADERLLLYTGEV